MFKSLKSGDRYFAQWQKLQQLRSPMRRILLITVGVAILLSVLAVFSVVFLIVAGVVFVVGGLAWMAAMIRGLYWRCPRCQRRFYFSAGRGYRPWSDQCQHCDLPEFAPDDPVNQQWETIDVSSTPVRQ